MSVYQRPDSPTWWMHVELAPKGKQKRSTGIAIGVTAAEEKASRVEAERVYHAAAVLAGQVKAGTAPPEKIVCPTLAAFVRDVYAAELARHKGVDREREIVNRWVRDLGPVALDAITKDRIKAWRTTRRATAVTVPHFGGPNGKPHTFPLPSARTVNNEVGVLKQILNAAVPVYFPVSPLRGLPNLRVVVPKRHVMTDTEEAKIFRLLDPIDRAIILVGLDALVRPGDVLDLRREDDHGAVLYIADPKNGQPIEVPVSRRLRAALDAVPVDPRHPEWYFPTRRRAKSERTRSATIAKALRSACERAGVAYGRKVNGVTLHWATRRTGATRMLRRLGEQGIAVVQQIGGWKDVSVLLGIYRDMSTKEKRDAVEAVAPRGKAARAGFAVVGRKAGGRR
jgi:integrase